MIGTKVLCIKNSKIHFINKIYVIDDFAGITPDIIIRIPTGVHNGIGNGSENCWFNLNEGYEEEFYFYKYFITLAEFREQRINKILNG